MNDNSVRRVPQGERGRRRVALILEAAELELAEVGYDNLTTNAVAARAGISIGSIYQFYPNKEALVEALAERYHAEMRALYDRLFSALDPELTVRQMIDHLIDPLVAYNVSNKAFESLFCSPQAPMQQMTAVGALRAEIIGRANALFGARRPEMDASQRSIYVAVSVHAVEALLPLASRGETERRAEMLREIKRLLIAYLEPVLGA